MATCLTEKQTTIISATNYFRKRHNIAWYRAVIDLKT